jgi:hypothetical protein
MKFAEDMKSYKTLKAEKIHLTLTLGKVDMLINAIELKHGQTTKLVESQELETLLGKLDAAVNS